MSKRFMLIGLSFALLSLPSANIYANSTVKEQSKLVSLGGDRQTNEGKTPSMRAPDQFAPRHQNTQKNADMQSLSEEIFTYQQIGEIHAEIFNALYSTRSDSIAINMRRVADYFEMHYSGYYSKKEVQRAIDTSLALYSKFGMIGEHGNLQLNSNSIKRMLDYVVGTDLITSSFASQLKALFDRANSLKERMDIRSFTMQVRNFKAEGKRDADIIQIMQAVANASYRDVQNGTIPVPPVGNWFTKDCIGALVGTAALPIVGTIICCIGSSCEKG